MGALWRQSRACFQGGGPVVTRGWLWPRDSRSGRRAGEGSAADHLVVVVSVPAYRGRSADSPDGDFRRGVYAFVRGPGPRAERRGGMVAHKHQALEWKP